MDVFEWTNLGGDFALLLDDRLQRLAALFDGRCDAGVAIQQPLQSGVQFQLIRFVQRGADGCLGGHGGVQFDADSIRFFLQSLKLQTTKQISRFYDLCFPIIFIWVIIYYWNARINSIYIRIIN